MGKRKQSKALMLWMQAQGLVWCDPILEIAMHAILKDRKMPKKRKGKRCRK